VNVERIVPLFGYAIVGEQAVDYEDRKTVD
jgi:hypothetical protein